jgi:predicted signal transduction protein with EAL and GGDEF domain
LTPNHVVQKIADSIAKPPRAGGRELNATTSVGLNFYPTDAETPEGVLRNADASMYRVVASGRGRYIMYDRRFEQDARERLSREQPSVARRAGMR